MIQLATMEKRPAAPARQSTHPDARGLEAMLRKTLRGEVRFDAGSRALYATDASNYRQVPIGVVVPKSVDDVIASVATCRRYGAPILARGGGTSLAGQCCNVAVVFDFSKYLNRILEIDPHRKRARAHSAPKPHAGSPGETSPTAGCETDPV